MGWRNKGESRRVFARAKMALGLMRTIRIPARFSPGVRDTAAPRDAGGCLFKLKEHSTFP